ncbi:MAG: helix-turn-helix domain-containing protein [Gammaproteobacteria bacterium]|nr:helix-turn-helix domain-containing protein [Gammaproteobacteria bacterium]
MSDGKDQTRRSAYSLESLTTEQFLKLLGARVKKQRMKVSMSRKLLAQESGVSERYLAQLESGQGNISITLLRNVAIAIGITLEQLVSAQCVSGMDECKAAS